MRYILLYLMLFRALGSSAQYFDLSFEHISTENGLSNEVVNTIARDKTGFIWFGTNDGLNRFDGRNFKIIKARKHDSSGLPSGKIQSMAFDDDGWLWLVTGKGICLYQPGNEEFRMLPIPGNDGKHSLLLSNVAFQGDYAWFLCEEFLYRIHRENYSFKRFPIPSVESFYSINIDKKDRIWILLRNSIYRFYEKTGEFNYYGGMNNLYPDEELLMGRPVISGSDTLFVSTYGRGIFYFDEKKDRFEKWNKNSHLIAAALEDRDEKGRRFFWCLGGSTGLFIYDPVTDRFQEIQNNPRDPFSHTAVECNVIYKDTAAGIVWIGTKAGIEKYDPRSIRFQRKFLPESFGYGSFALLGEVVKDKTDPSGNTYWIGSWALGLLKWNRLTNTFTNFNMRHGLLHHEVFCVTQSRFGYLIIASKDGVQLFDPRTEKPIKQIKDFFSWPVSRKILYATEDKDGNIWMVANYEGVYQYEIKTGKTIHWDIPGVIPEKGPYLLGNIQQDWTGKLWISGFLGKLFTIDPASGLLSEIKNVESGSGDQPGAIVSVSINNQLKEIWVSGMGNYLARLDEKGRIIKMFRETEPYDGNGYNMIIQDPDGFIWASAGNYIQRINTKTGIRDYFGNEDGLSGKSGLYGASITDDGELFLGFQFSFSHINTKRIFYNQQPPRIAISSSKVNYAPRMFDERGVITLYPKERVLSLEFAALNYTQPQHNRFAYKLEGYDKDWYYGNDHDLTLMNLEPGTHHLFVKASNNDGVWSDPIELKIKVIPPFYKTAWFKLIIALLLSSIVYLIYWYRRQQKKKLEKIRNRIATDLHDDMGSTLSSIRIFSDVAKKQVEEIKPETVQLLDRISNNATSLSENIQDIIWTIRSDNDTFDDLVSRMREFGLRVCEAKNIRFHVQVSQNFKMSKLNLEQRRNLYLIFKESINNAVKYADSTRIDLFLTQQGRYLKMEITDNGKGFDKASVRKGNGLNNLEKRAGEIHGEMEINSKPGKGTMVRLMMRLKTGFRGEAVNK